MDGDIAHFPTPAPGQEEQAEAEFAGEQNEADVEDDPVPVLELGELVRGAHVRYPFQ